MPCARLRACAIWARVRVVACVCVPCGAYEVACHRCARAAGWRVWMHTCATPSQACRVGHRVSASGRGQPRRSAPPVPRREQYMARTTPVHRAPCTMHHTLVHHATVQHATDNGITGRRPHGMHAPGHAVSAADNARLRDLRVRLVPTRVAVSATTWRRRLHAPCRSCPCNRQRTPCDMQQRTSCNMQATCSVAARNMQDATCDMRRTTCNNAAADIVQHATRNMHPAPAAAAAAEWATCTSPLTRMRARADGAIEDDASLAQARPTTTRRCNVAPWLHGARERDAWWRCRMQRGCVACCRCAGRS